MLARAAAALLAAASAAPALAAGLTLTFDTPEGQKKVEFEAERMRSEEDGGVDIFDGKRMVQLNVQDRTYQVVDAESTKAMVAAARAQLDGYLKALPPEQRAQAEQAMAQQRAGAKLPAITYQRVGGTGSAAGARCDWHRTLLDGQAGPSAEEACYAPWGSLGLQKSDFKVLDRLAAFARSMAEAAGVPPQGQAAYRQGFDRMPGFPVIEAKVEGGRRVVTSTLAAVKRGAIPGDRFSPPAGYRQVPMDQFRSASKRRNGGTGPGDPGADDPEEADGPPPAADPAPGRRK
jgi:hypothetical protein